MQVVILPLCPFLVDQALLGLVPCPPQEEQQVLQASEEEEDISFLLLLQALAPVVAPS